MAPQKKMELVPDCMCVLEFLLNIPLQSPPIPSKATVQNAPIPYLPTPAKETPPCIGAWQGGSEDASQLGKGGGKCELREREKACCGFSKENRAAARLCVCFPAVSAHPTCQVAVQNVPTHSLSTPGVMKPLTSWRWQGGSEDASQLGKAGGNRMEGKSEGKFL